MKFSLVYSSRWKNKFVFDLEINVSSMGGTTVSPFLRRNLISLRRKKIAHDMIDKLVKAVQNLLQA